MEEVAVGSVEKRWQSAVKPHCNTADRRARARSRWKEELPVTHWDPDSDLILFLVHWGCLASVFMMRPIELVFFVMHTFLFPLIIREEKKAIIMYLYIEEVEGYTGIDDNIPLNN